ncbi:phosphoenolpyruvate--protein phosphotransferase [Anaerocolumna chitinilytica]|uniref:Phosphoenolpyruvate-protein phosphotransferase n=1 Tax=Anaerocolumna chitinilytica TaxID=1727145 RepID=A0A7I8DMX2_9FIRM|nr:phosphoenolpyruvate--protein phosphotransferase [Anaerocolumna chitinilytica]BCJ98641.1 phosphoenolpyruvate-protein phosphotransferase [Anaerocolumna chitinilytica]
MKSYYGKCVFSGIAMGPVCLIKQGNHAIKKYTVENIEDEMQRFLEAKAVAVEQLEILYQKAQREIGEEEALIFDAHQMMLNDLDFLEGISNMISQNKVNAEFAVSETGKNIAEIFSGMDDDYMKARATDILDVSQRVISIMSGSQTQVLQMTEPVIIIAEDLTPSETIQFDKQKVLAFVTKKGSANSHTAILARMMNVPYLIAGDIELLSELNNMQAIVDSEEGILLLEPDAATALTYGSKQEALLKKRSSQLALKGMASATKSGRKVKLYANIGGPDDLDMALSNDTEGIGLFRSEFLYMGRSDYPSEEEQFQAYQKVIQGMKGKPVIIRTLDIGADKQADYFEIPQEENPAMGFRAIRICLERVQIFKAQLRAIYRASAFGTTAIMFPMIISLEEIIKIKEIVVEVKEELLAEGISFGQVELGIMIETPAAVMVSDELAREVDFFSIGTNDLTQYTLAIDRQNQSLENYYNPHHKALLRMIEMTVNNAHDAGIWCGICGELAADMEITEQLLCLGVDELSVSPVFILPLRERIRAID